jgi:hypothetical protein
MRGVTTGAVPRVGETILMTGPPGAGKTTTAMVWAVQRPRPTFFVDWDAVRSVVVVGDQLEGRPARDLDAQYRLAARVAAAQADWITRSGVDCVIAGARFPSPPPEFADVWTDLDALDPIVVVLLPRLGVCLERNATDAARLGDFAVDQSHVTGSFEQGWDSWADHPRAVVLDTSDKTPQEVVDAVEAAVLRLTA